MGPNWSTKDKTILGAVGGGLAGGLVGVGL